VARNEHILSENYGETKAVGPPSGGPFFWSERWFWRLVSMEFRKKVVELGFDFVEFQQGLQKRLQTIQVKGVRSVTFCLRGVVVDLEEDSVDAGGDGGACQNGNELRLTAGGSVSG